MANNEKMRVLDLLESGKISAPEAAELLSALGNSRLVNAEMRENMEEKVQQFAKDVNKFAKELGCRMQELYKDVEPKIKKASQKTLEKCATALDNLASNINESLESAANEAEAETTVNEDDTPGEN